MTSLVKVKLVCASEITAHMRSGHCRGILGNPETASIGEKSRLHSQLGRLGRRSWCNLVATVTYLTEQHPLP
jgi:hypothetical protein